MDEIISQSHKGSIRSSLLIAEMHLQDIKRELELDVKARHKTTMYKAIDDIDAKAKPKMIKLIKEMLGEIERMREDFDLEVKEQGIGEHIAGMMGEIWVVLEEITPRQLGNYGKVSEAEKALIEPRALKLLEQFNALEKIFGDSRVGAYGKA